MAQAIGDDRAISFPAFNASVGEMIEALKRTATNRKLGPIRVAPDPVIEKIVATWPIDSAFDRALALGLPQDGRSTPSSRPISPISSTPEGAGSLS